MFLSDLLLKMQIKIILFAINFYKIFGLYNNEQIK